MKKRRKFSAEFKVKVAQIASDSSTDLAALCLKYLTAIGWRITSLDEANSIERTGKRVRIEMRYFA